MSNVSLHKSINASYEKTKADNIGTVYDRFQAQGKRCSYCVQGTSCQLCSQGPCRIIRGRAERGACGIDAAGMVMRNILHVNNFGIASYTFHCKEAAKTLIATAKGMTPFSIKDEAKLDILADALGIDRNLPAGEKAVKVGEAVLVSLNQDSSEESIMIQHFAPESRKKVWRTLGILPGGPLSEMLESTTRSMTNIDGDYLSLAKSALRLGLASLYGSLIPIELIQDALFGTPKPHRAQVDLGVLDPAYVNILPNGHEPFVGAALIKAAGEKENQDKAKAAGAKGIHIVGSIETGQELMQRYECDDIFVGLTGNWISQEFALSTGAVDVFAMDMNCSIPSLKEVADKYGTTLVAVSRLIGIPGVDKRIDYVPEKVAAQAKQLIDMAVENFKRRKANKITNNHNKTEIITGFSTEAILGALGGTLEPLLDAIKNGSIKGVVALVSCATLTNGPHDGLTVEVCRELIKRNILVISAGCGNAACQVAGLNSLAAQDLAGAGLKAVCKSLGVPPVLSFGTCTDCGRIALLVTAVANALGVDPSQLPVAVTAPQYMEQKATIDAFGAVALGLYTHVSPAPPAAGSEQIIKLLTEDVEGLVGGKIALGDEAPGVVDAMVEHIDRKRAALGI